MTPNPSLERDLHRHGTWPASPSFLSSASRAKRHTGVGPSAQTLGVTRVPGVVRIVEATAGDSDAVLSVERAAFAREDEAALVADLLKDPTARPSLSLLAFLQNKPVGHVLFTKASLAEASRPTRAAILAPLAVLPEFQRQGVGRALIEHGASLLAASGVQLLFVLGHPGYYTRCGFVPAVPSGLRAPYTIVPEEAWMVRPLVPGVLGSVTGVIACPESMAKPEYWRE